MGEARRRGTFEQRRAQAIARRREHEAREPAPRRTHPRPTLPAVLWGLAGVSVLLQPDDDPMQDVPPVILPASED